jgi:hypothetical protein
MNFNQTFQEIFAKLSQDNYRYFSELENLNIFTNFGEKLSYDDDEVEDDLNNLENNSISLDDFRRLLILHFISKFTNKK